MNVEERARFKALLDGFEHNALRDNEIKELIELARKAEEEEALRGIAGNGLIPGKPWPTKT